MSNSDPTDNSPTHDPTKEATQLPAFVEHHSLEEAEPKPPSTLDAQNAAIARYMGTLLDHKFIQLHDDVEAFRKVMPNIGLIPPLAQDVAKLQGIAEQNYRTSKDLRDQIRMTNDEVRASNADLDRINRKVDDLQDAQQAHSRSQTQLSAEITELQTRATSIEAQIDTFLQQTKFRLEKLVSEKHQSLQTQNNQTREELLSLKTTIVKDFGRVRLEVVNAITKLNREFLERISQVQKNLEDQRTLGRRYWITTTVSLIAAVAAIGAAIAAWASAA